jgi:SAM-dependent methyltransferase
LNGNETFYRELEHEDYFVQNRPEFHRTLRLARQHRLRRVLDVGCGSGIFLDLARQSGRETCGLELNSAAAAKARAKGHEVFDCMLHELSRGDVAGGFDLITFFQVIEHVPQPVTLLRQAAALLNPEGRISVAVPSAKGVLRLVPFDPHQWPPHHMSRWRSRDLKQLACAAELKTVESGGDLLLGSELTHFWRIHNLLAPALGRAERPGGRFLFPAFVWLYRRTGMKFVAPHWGSSIYACFQPGSPSRSPDKTVPKAGTSTRR